MVREPSIVDMTILIIFTILVTLRPPLSILLTSSDANPTFTSQRCRKGSCNRIIAINLMAAINVINHPESHS